MKSGTNPGSDDGRKTEQEYWDASYASRADAVRMRLPSSFRVNVRNFQRLMRAHVQPGMKVLEVGCAPGKNLAWVALALKARVVGLDYSEHGIATTARLFQSLGIEANLVCEDFFATTLPRGSFDVVYSNGVIEHFDDPGPIVRQHVDMLAPGGVAVITIPNYGGVYGRLQRWFDPANLDIHNLNIMSCEALQRLAPTDLAGKTDTFAYGRFSASLISLHKRLPGLVARGLSFTANGVALLQPADVSALCPWLVLRIERA